ncbi:hypothetical protein VPH35_122170 [Triticum aestivum]
MAPRRRAEGDPPPVYDEIDYLSNFSLCINFGGYFLGVGKNRAYVNGENMWYDYVEGDTLTVEKLEDLVEELGYEVKGRLQMYYCMPGKPMTEGGLVKITCNDNCLNMRAHVTFGHKFLQMYLDHDESFRQFDWDDVIEFPVADLPTVVSPIKPI